MTMEEKYGYEIDKGNLVSLDRRLTGVSQSLCKPPN